MRRRGSRWATSSTPAAVGTGREERWTSLDFEIWISDVIPHVSNWKIKVDVESPKVLNRSRFSVFRLLVQKACVAEHKASYLGSP